ncbi:acetylcholine receptor subunit beta [Helicoverpa armigera]|uniref:acetylcholine receptor subunit beta n=1 Tax=Helicoverpa armigera TaxID=29058 RepID=UPI003083B345
MLRTSLCVVFCLFLQHVIADNDTFVLTPKMAQQCKEHICRDGYSYKTFYSVDSDNLKAVAKDADTAFEMHIGIQAGSNGHILLSPIYKPGYKDPVYEIVVGGGGNQFTELRRNLKRNARSSVKTPRILSSFEVRGFYIKITQDGIIEFGKEGSALPLLSYIDVDPLEIKYFSFAAWTGVEAKFLYDCPIPSGNGTEPSPDSKEIEPPLSISDELKRSRLLYRLPWIPPKPQMDVRLGIKVTNVKYDAFNSKLVTAMSVVISWTDESMAWFPGKFNNTLSLKFRQGQIWRPKFHVFNSDNEGIFDARNSDLISMSYNGEATFHFQTKVYTWCVDSPPGLSKWPHDEYMCSIVIQPWEAHEKIFIDPIDPKDPKMHIFSDIDEVINNEWEMTTKQIVIGPTIWNKVYITDDNETHQSDRMIINVQVKRRAEAYNIVFYTPLIVLMWFVLMSFWSEPLTMNRIWFLTSCSIVICMGLCYIDYLIPSHTTPSILVLYTTVLAGVLLAILIQVCLMTPEMESIRTTETVQKVMNVNILRTIFCMPGYLTSSDRNGGYSLQEDEDPQPIPITRDVEEMEAESQRMLGDKKDLAEFVDRILFVIYSITFAAMLAAHF